MVSRMKRVKMRDYDYTSSNFSKITIMLYRMGKKIFINTDKCMKKKKQFSQTPIFPFTLKMANFEGKHTFVSIAKI